MINATLNLHHGDTEVKFGVDKVILLELERRQFFSEYSAISLTANHRIERVARLIGKMLSVPCVSIALSPEAGLQRVATVGLPPGIAPKASLFMDATREYGRSFTVYDTNEDARFVKHPLVIGPPFIRSALCSPLKHNNGWFIGHVATWDSQPRTFGVDDIQLLESLADVVIDELELYRAMLIGKHRAQLLQGMFKNAAVGISISRLDGSRLAANATYASMMGYCESELIDAAIYDVMHPADREQGQIFFRQLREREIPSYQREARYVRKDGSWFWGKSTVSLMTGGSDQETLIIAITENIHERRQAEESTKLLIGEVNHRVKNTLAIVQGIAKRILRTTNSVNEFATAFEARLQALAKSHDMLNSASWRPLALDIIIKEMLAGALEPYTKQVEFVGPPVNLNAQTTVMLGLQLYELMTNAIKYGALKSQGGRVKIEATVSRRCEYEWLKLVWREFGENKILPMTRKGLGFYLIERGAKLGLGGEGRVEFLPRGIVCEISFPVYSEPQLARRDFK